MAHASPILKLVGEPSVPAEATIAVARENRAAALIGPTDARWIFATSVAASLEGGRLALLRPQARQRLLARADDLGLRPFDANLVIAIVQDAAQGGRALSRETQERLVMVPLAQGSSSVVPQVLASLALAVVTFYALIHWING